MINLFHRYLKHVNTNRYKANEKRWSYLLFLSVEVIRKETKVQ